MVFAEEFLLLVGVERGPRRLVAQSVDRELPGLLHGLGRLVHGFTYRTSEVRNDWTDLIGVGKQLASLLEGLHPRACFNCAVEARSGNRQRTGGTQRVKP